ncbi:MAG TPA: 50S ribosomal protein L29 [Patescibacteria group bacterium]|nr:50S ribosomal protein L29 [Patescibacteria group bacterium]
MTKKQKTNTTVEAAEQKVKVEKLSQELSVARVQKAMGKLKDLKKIRRIRLEKARLLGMLGNK